MAGEATELLQELGLTEYEAKCISSLFKLKSAKATEISMDSQVPKTRIYDILEQLEKKKLVIAVHDKPKKYAVVDAEKVIEHLLEQKKSELKNLEEKALSVSIKIKNKSGLESDEEKIIKVKKLGDFGTILGEEIKNATKSINGFSNLVLDNSILLKQLNEKNKTVPVRIIHSTGAKGDSSFALKKGTHEIEAIMIDNEKLFLGIGTAEENKTEHHFALIKNKPMIDALQNHFELNWNK